MTTVTFIHLVLALVVVEAIVLWLVLPRRWPHLSRSALLATLAAGASLMLALRALALGASVFELALWLTAALAAHLLDLALRLTATHR